MNTQTKLILAAIAGGIALGFGGASVLGVAGTAQTGAPEADAKLQEQLQAVEADREALQDAVFETQERLASLARELEAARNELEDMRAGQALAAADSTMDDFAQWEAEMDEVMAQAGEPEIEPDAGMRDAQAAQEGRGRRWDPERVAEMRAERDERVRGFFDEAFERAPSRESQERIAAIEAYTQDAMSLMREWRGADESEREVLREQMGSMRDTMRDIVREEHDARVREAAAQLGVEDAAQQQALADAIREVQQDPIFRGGAWTGRGRGPAPMWGGGGRGGPPSR